MDMYDLSLDWENFMSNPNFATGTLVALDLAGVAAPGLTANTAKKAGKIIKNGVGKLFLVDGSGKVFKIAKNAELGKYVDEAGEKVGKDLGKGISKSVEVVQDGTQLIKNNKGKVVRLKPNVTYKSGEFDYFYKTDENGRIATVNVEDLKLSDIPRIRHNPNTPGKLNGDHAGHLVADRFGGSPEIDNLISQLSTDNLSSYKKLENTWAKAIDRGQKVEVKLKLNYINSQLRPNQYSVDYIIDGVPNRQIFNN